MVIFPTFFLKQCKPGKCLLRYSRTKKRLSRLYNQKFQKVEEVDIFPKGSTYDFRQKMAIFPTSIFFRKCRLGKRPLRYPRTKKKKKYKKLKN